MLLDIQDLSVQVGGKKVIKNLSLGIQKGEVHALMGRNGSGKSTLSLTLAGHPKYKVTNGRIFLDGEDITQLSADERARRRLFLAFQYPVAIPGVTVANFLRASIRSVRGEEVPAKEMRKFMRAQAAELRIPESFFTRSLNEGFSGGEKKKLEMLQMRLLAPKMAVLDETDSGLDIDALKLIAEKVEALKNEERSILVITHYQRLLDHLKPDVVHVLLDGEIVKTGDASLAQRLEKEGYDWLGEARA